MRIERADGPFPITISKTLSSIAGYRISSTTLDSLWISSIKRTSLSFRLVNKDAKSPVFSIAGPEVTLKFTPISWAIIPARVVFPKPGGPYNSTWSKGSPYA